MYTFELCKCNFGCIAVDVNGFICVVIAEKKLPFFVEMMSGLQKTLIIVLYSMPFNYSFSSLQ